MNTLFRKLLRTIKTTRGQFLGLAAIVMVGVAVYVSMSTVYMNLSRSEEKFYQDYNFADYYFIVVKAPDSAARDAASVPGVAQAAGRVQKDLTFLRPSGERGVIRVTGCSYPLDQGINRFLMQQGRVFDRRSSGERIETVIDQGFYEALRTQHLSEIDAIADNRMVKFSVVGMMAAPEFIYPMQDANNLFPKPGYFGICMVEEQQAQQLLDMPGQINQVLIRLDPGADAAQVKGRIEGLLKPYGLISTVEKKYQLSNFVVDAKIKGLNTVATVLPVIFFLVAAGVQFVIISRMIGNQRQQIGVIKALGYEDWRIIAHYSSYAVAASLCGTAAGVGIGVVLASSIAQTYARYFNLPQVLSGVNGQAIVMSFLITGSIGTIAGIMASYRITRINPAESMRPEPPRSAHHAWIESWAWLWQRLGTTFKISIRSIARNRVRTAVTVLGLAAAVLVLVLGFVTRDAMDFVMQRQYGQENMYNYLVHFDHPVKQSEILYWQRWPEISRMENRLEVPVRLWASQAAEDSGQDARDEVLIGMAPTESLKRILDADGRPMALPEDGVVLSDRVANKLGLKIGDRLTGETSFGRGPSRAFSLVVMGISTSYMGSGSYVSLATANRLLGEEGLCNAVMLDVDPGGASRFEARLQDMPAVSAVVSQAKDLDNITQLLANIKYTVGIMLLFSLVLGVAIAFNAITMNVAERQRELTLMMVLGMTRFDVARVMLADILVQTTLGILVGLPAGRWLAGAYLASVQSDMYSFPLVIYAQTYAECVILTVVFVLIGFLISIRRLRGLDMVEVLKEST